MDEIDFRILREIQFNARISNAKLAQAVSLSPSPCWNRLRSLEREGVIEKYVTIINHAALGLPDTVVIEVRNAGADIDPSVIKRLFDPNISGGARSDDRHLGLGLYIARQIAVAHGGSIDVESSGGQTRFTVRLPDSIDG